MQLMYRRKIFRSNMSTPTTLSTISNSHMFTHTIQITILNKVTFTAIIRNMTLRRSPVTFIVITPTIISKRNRLMFILTIQSMTLKIRKLRNLTQFILNTHKKPQILGRTLNMILRSTSHTTTTTTTKWVPPRQPISKRL